jgi:hypothetical protein
MVIAVEALQECKFFSSFVEHFGVVAVHSGRGVFPGMRRRGILFFGDHRVYT